MKPPGWMSRHNVQWKKPVSKCHSIPLIKHFRNNKTRYGEWISYPEVGGSDHKESFAGGGRVLNQHCGDRHMNLHAG